MSEQWSISDFDSTFEKEDKAHTYNTSFIKTPKQNRGLSTAFAFLDLSRNHES